MCKIVHSLKRVLSDSISKCKDLETFNKIHALLLTSGILCNDSVINRAIDFLGQSVDFVDYASSFLKRCDFGSSTLPYNRLISFYASSDGSNAAVLVYRRIVRDGFLPDKFTFPAVLKSCARFVGILEGYQFHGIVVKMGFVNDLYVQNSLVHFYGVCGYFGHASQMFDEMLVRDVVSWTSIISAYVKAGLFDEVLALFLRMDAEPNVATFVSLLIACGRKGFLRAGEGIHGLIFKRALVVNLEASNALMDMYVKCECLTEAKKIFDELPQKDIVSWTSIISGLVQCKRPKESLELFSSMQNSGVKPDKIILTSVLSACASLGALDYGRWVHKYIDWMALRWDTQIGTAMVDMYAKCGCVELALQTFCGMAHKNVLTWNVLLNGLAMHGHVHEALKLFEEMVRLGLKPNEVTFLAILMACCHSGLVDEGRYYFHQITSQQWGLSPKLEHYGCMVDLLCKAGQLDEALELLKSMPMQPDLMIMGTVLSACKANGVVQLPQEILDHLMELESHDSGLYVLLSDMCAINQRWADVRRIRRLLKEKGLTKPPGLSIIEVDGEAYEFVVADTRHPKIQDIHILLKFLANQIFLEGPHTHS